MQKAADLVSRRSARMHELPDQSSLSFLACFQEFLPDWGIACFLNHPGHFDIIGIRSCFKGFRNIVLGSCCGGECLNHIPVSTEIVCSTFMIDDRIQRYDLVCQLVLFIRTQVLHQCPQKGIGKRPVFSGEPFDHSDGFPHLRRCLFHPDFFRKRMVGFCKSDECPSAIFGIFGQFLFYKVVGNVCKGASDSFCGFLASPADRMLEQIST